MSVIQPTLSHSFIWMAIIIIRSFHRHEHVVCICNTVYTQKNLRSKYKNITYAFNTGFKRDYVQIRYAGSVIHIKRCHVVLHGNGTFNCGHISKTAVQIAKIMDAPG